MNVLIIEDEKLASDRLSRMLKAEIPDLIIADVLQTVRAAIDWFQKSPQLDLIFCDIHLADGKCFEIFETVEVNFPIIFTTAYDQYSIDAFRYNSVQYLLKPISKESLQQSLQKFQTYHQPLNWHALKNWLSQEDNDRKILMRSGVHIISKKCSEIAAFYVKHKVVYGLDRESGKSYIVDHTLESLEQDVISPKSFFRINRSAIVQNDAIASITPTGGQRYLVNLKTDHNFELVVSREKVREFKKWYLE
jgi:DNA-binding LytR/AlgR family response regulator